MFDNYDDLMTLLSSINAYPSGSVYTDSEGKLIVPNTATAFLIVDPISDTTVNGWIPDKYQIERFQLTAFATTRTLAMAKLNAAAALIPRPPWRKLIARDNGRVGIYFTFTQDYGYGD